MTKNIFDIRRVLYTSLEDGNLGRTLAQIKRLGTRNQTDGYLQISDTYHRLLEYRFDGVEDPQRDKVFQQLLRDTYELTDEICQQLMPLEYAEHPVFSEFWTATHYGTQEIERCKQLLANNDLTNSCMAIAAITLSGLRVFDETKLQCLYLWQDSPYPIIHIRALTGLLLCLVLYQHRLYLYPSINNLLNRLFDDEQRVQEVRNICKQLICSKETERITQDIKNNILPSLSKIVPEFQKKMEQKHFDADEYDESSYVWQDMLNDSALSEKMQTYAEMQFEGSDINMGSFSQLKAFPFFHQMENWFMPFTSALYLAYFDQEGWSQMMDLLQRSHLLCDSDKHSLVFHLLTIDKNLRKTLADQLNAYTGENNNEEIQRFQTTQLSNLYLQDCYRFFKLYPNKQHFEDVFNRKMDIHKCPFFRFLNQDNAFLPELADFYLQKGMYDSALSAYQQWEASGEHTAELYRKMGFCLQKGLMYSQAAEAYQKADLLEPGHTDCLRKLAYCYRKIYAHDQALTCYLQLGNLQSSEDLHLLFNIGRCYVETRQFPTALKYFAKIEYLDLDAPKSGSYPLYYGHALWAVGRQKEALLKYKQFTPFNQLEENLRLSPVGFSHEEIIAIIDYLRYLAAPQA